MLLAFSFGNVSCDGEDLEFGVGEDDVAALLRAMSVSVSLRAMFRAMFVATYGKELQK